MMSNSPPVALLFDVFGTCVDWRTTVTKVLIDASRSALESSSPLPRETRSVATGMTEDDWGRFAQEWRDTYKRFTRALSTLESRAEWKTVDQHNFDSLISLMKEWKLEGLLAGDELLSLSLVWHRLDPWPDSPCGMERLNTSFQTATLSNGNVSLLQDLKEYSKINFSHIISAEQFGAYKPSPKVYLGAAEKLNLDPAQCAMIAAHLSDLKAAKACGFQTIYVERPHEEDFSTEEIREARNDSFVDLWITAKEEGFVTLASRLGIES
jgi:2-haloacid dehalogenase